MKTFLTLVLALTSVLTLSACEEKSARVLFDGKYYPAKTKKVDGDRQFFVVSVSKVAQGLEDAREAGRHSAVRYCVKNYGLSDMTWSQGPDAEESDLQIDNGKLILKGKCSIW